jgi:hypothetical protein
MGLFETFFFNTVEERLAKKWLSENNRQNRWPYGRR